MKKSEEEELLNDFFASIAEEEAKFAKTGCGVCLSSLLDGVCRKQQIVETKMHYQ